MDEVVSELSLQRRFEQAVAVIDAYERADGPLALVGFNMSGQTVADLVRHYGDRVAALVLCAPAVYTAKAWDVPFGDGNGRFSGVIRQPDSWREAPLEVLRAYEGRTVLTVPGTDAVIPPAVTEAALAARARYTRFDLPDVQHPLGIWFREHGDDKAGVRKGGAHQPRRPGLTSHPRIDGRTALPHGRSVGASHLLSARHGDGPGREAGRRYEAGGEGGRRPAARSSSAGRRPCTKPRHQTRDCPSTGTEARARGACDFGSSDGGVASAVVRSRRLPRARPVRCPGSRSALPRYTWPGRSPVAYAGGVEPPAPEGAPLRDHENVGKTGVEGTRKVSRSPETASHPQQPGLLPLQATMGNAAVVQMLRQAGHHWAEEERRHSAECGHDRDGQPAVQRSAVREVLRSPGRPLDSGTRADMEARFGADFSDVRIHNDSAAKASAAEVGARAYTSGSHVVIGDGGGDRHTLAHELTHVIQQRQGPVAGTDNGAGLRVSDPSDRFEREAEANARRVMTGHPGAQRDGEAVRKPAAAGSDTPARASLQRAKLNIRPKDTAKHKAGTISGVSDWGNRPPSNLRGHQGQHRTAFVVFKNAVKNRVVDRTPADAAQALIGLIEEYRALPGMRQKNAQYLHDYFKSCADDLEKAGKSNDVKLIGELIDQILGARNQVPGTAEHGEGGGHGEADSSGVVQTVEEALRAGEWDGEWKEEVVAGQMCHNLWRLLDYDPNSPGSDEEKRKKIQTALLTHYQSVSSAYPHVWNWLTNKGYYLSEYLLEHRLESGMPLTKLSDAEFVTAVTFVHENL
ncbi:DUF4157 domain-containing protein [Streptomyces sp. NPDC001279]|uniref:eCIS core domain-containing protein n=1 Tax=Streptomyces sp. NPDC001279 TaxID=3364556 RepID=UPI0036C61F7B